MRLFILILLFLPLRSTGAAQVLFNEDETDRPPHVYDVLHYKLVLAFDEGQKEVNGTCSITLSPLAPDLDSVRFNAVNMEIHSVRSETGQGLAFSNDSNFVTVGLDTQAMGKDSLTVAIEYSCNPREGLYFIQPDSGNLTRHWQIWTQGEETENRYWFPCYDFPDDKATSEVIATVRDSYTLLSNGLLVSEEHDVEQMTRTFHWKQSKPHSSYLIMLAAGEYSILHGEYNDIPLMDYVYPEDIDKGPYSFRKTAAIMEYFEEIIGYPYPWDKHAHIILDDFMWGGMENTSAVTLNKAYIYDKRAALDYSADDVVAHELAHQWWGDLVTCTDWSQLWLHEGFANYYEALFKRKDQGLDEFQYEAYQWSRRVRQVEEASGRKPVVSPESYTANLYQKGAWVLRMLSYLLGEETFFKCTSQFVKKHEFENVSTEDFLASVEETTGEDFDWFFDQWLYRAGHPELEVETDWDEDAGILDVTVTQTQEVDSLTGLFRFPMAIEMTTKYGRDLRKVWVSDKEENFKFRLDAKPLMIIIDKGLNVLKSLDYPRTKSALLFQLQEGDDVPDRLDALDALGDSMDDEDVFRTVRITAGSDPFWAVRVKATQLLAENEDEETKDILFALYDDTNSRVREAAIKGLGNFKGEDIAEFIRRAALADSSYIVLSACINTLALVDSLRAFELAERTVNLDSYRDMIRRASLHTLRAVKDPKGLEAGLRCSRPDCIPFTRISAIGLIKELGKENPEAQQSMRRLAADLQPDVRAAAVRALGKWGGEENMAFLKKRKEIEEEGKVLIAIDEALNGE